MFSLSFRFSRKRCSDCFLAIGSPAFGLQAVCCCAAAPVNVSVGTAMEISLLAEAPDVVVMVDVGEVALQLEIAVVASIMIALALCAGTS